MRFRNIAELTFAELSRLTEAGLREGRDLDFKRDCVGNSDSDKREFHADVSSFANTDGGHIFFGVEEAEGLATAIPGITLENPDAEILRLSSTLATGLEPRLPGVEITWLPGDGSRGVLAVHVQRSWASPHRVIASRHFFRRNSAGKYPMDVQELKAAFGEHDRALSSLRTYRASRLNQIAPRECAIPTPLQPRLVLHVMPLASFYGISDFSEDNPAIWMRPLSPVMGFNRRYVLEGFATTAAPTDDGSFGTYTLLMRNGVVEGVSTVGWEDNDGRWVSLADAEEMIVEGTQRYIRALVSLGVPPPWLVFASLTYVQGARRRYTNPFFAQRDPPYHTRDALIPEVIIGSEEELSQDPMRRVVAQMWNAFGHAP